MASLATILQNKKEIARLTSLKKTGYKYLEALTRRKEKEETARLFKK